MCLLSNITISKKTLPTHFMVNIRVSLVHDSYLTTRYVWGGSRSKNSLLLYLLMSTSLLHSYDCPLWSQVYFESLSKVFLFWKVQLWMVLNWSTISVSSFSKVSRRLHTHFLDFSLNWNKFFLTLRRWDWSSSRFGPTGPPLTMCHLRKR